MPRPQRVERRAERVAEARDELLELLDLQQVGLLVNAIQPGPALLLEVVGHGLVGQQHELLDEPVRDVALGDDDVLDPPGLVHQHFGLRQVEVHRPSAPPPAVEDPEQLVHQIEQRQQRRVAGARRRVAGGENRVDVRVGHPLVAVDDPVVELHADDVAVASDLHQARLHQPIHVRLERAQSRRQLRRKHVDGPFREIDRRAALVRLGVERAALLDVVRDVGDVHAQPVVPVGQPLERDRIVEVARVLAVDGHRRLRPEVGAAIEVARPDRGAQRRGLGDRVLAVDVGQRVLADDDARVDAGRIDGAQHLDHAAQPAAASPSASA